MSDLIPCRIERTEKYRSISLLAVEDPRLSWAAKGLHTYLISRPGGWKLYYSDLLQRSCNSRTALKSTVRELKDAGYIILEPVQGEDGKFKGWSWVVFEEPQTVEKSQSTPKAQKPSFGFPERRRNRQTENVQGNNNHSSNNHKTTTTEPVVVEDEEKKENAPSKFPPQNNEIDEIVSSIKGTKLEGVISPGAIRAAITVYKPEAHAAHQPEIPIEGIRRILRWMLHSKIADNANGFLRTMAEKGMDKPAAVVRAEQAAEVEQQEQERRQQERRRIEALKQEREIPPEVKPLLDQILGRAAV